MSQARHLMRPRASISPAQVGVGVSVIVTFIFLTIGPLIERKEAVETLMFSVDEGAMTQRMHLICKNVEGRLALNHALGRQELERRLRVAKVASQVGCMEALRPRYQTEYDLYAAPSQGRMISALIAQGAAAIEPSIFALDSEQPHVRRRAIGALLGLVELLNEDQRRRASKRLDPRDEHPQSVALMSALGIKLRPRALSPAPAPAPQLPPAPDPVLAPDPDPAPEPASSAPWPALTMPQLGQSLERPRDGVLFRAPSADAPPAQDDAAPSLEAPSL